MGSSPCIWWAGVNKRDGSTDVKATVRGLKAIGGRCGVYPIAGKDQSNSYSNFERLLEATKGTDIELWTVIIPPSEGSNSLPYGSNYLRWAREFAKLSVRFSNFRGFNIDDIDQEGSEKTFTREYLCKIYQAKNEINPGLLFVPTVYDLDSTTADRLAGCVDGVWLWWVNLEKATGLRSFLENTRYVVKGRFPVYGGVYAHWTSWHKSGESDPGVFKHTLSDTCVHADGAVIWNLSLDPHDALDGIAQTFEPKGSSPLASRCGVGDSVKQGLVGRKVE
jgi:hypothetical protein